MTAGDTDTEPGGMGAPGDESQGLSRSKDLPAIHGWGWCEPSMPRAMQEGSSYPPQPASQLLHVYGMSPGVREGLILSSKHLDGDQAGVGEPW